MENNRLEKMIMTEEDYKTRFKQKETFDQQPTRHVTL